MAHHSGVLLRKICWIAVAWCKLQKNPKQEYKREAFEMFTAMLERVKSEVVTILAKVQLRTEGEVAELEQRQKEAARQNLELQHANPSAQANEADADIAKQDQKRTQPETFVRNQPKVGRNDPCTCGSGKKYKQCCGKLS